MHFQDELEKDPCVPDSLCDLTMPINPIDLDRIIMAEEIGADIPEDIELMEAFRLHLIGKAIGAYSVG
jgi:hypothetical protein